jgi:hypothetical protein
MAGPRPEEAAVNILHKPGPPGGRDDEDALYEMANLSPRTTGLPMTVWVSPRGNARHDARVKVSPVHGNRMVITGAAVMGIRPQPALLEGTLDPGDVEAVGAWILLNRDILLAYWHGEADTADLITQLKRL